MRSGTTISGTLVKEQVRKNPPSKCHATTNQSSGAKSWIGIWWTRKSTKNRSLKVKVGTERMITSWNLWWWNIHLCRIRHLLVDPTNCYHGGPQHVKVEKTLKFQNNGLRVEYFIVISRKSGCSTQSSIPLSGLTPVSTPSSASSFSSEHSHWNSPINNRGAEVKPHHKDPDKRSSERNEDQPPSERVEDPPNWILSQVLLLLGNPYSLLKMTNLAAIKTPLGILKILITVR